MVKSAPKKKPSAKPAPSKSQPKKAAPKPAAKPSKTIVKKPAAAPTRKRRMADQVGAAAGGGVAGAAGTGGHHATPKRVLLLRHGQGTHNASHDYSYVDPMLTDQGKAQAKTLYRDPQLADVNLIVVSPMARAIQTAVAAFGLDGVPPPGVRVFLQPLHSERWSAPCDQGSRKSTLADSFPIITNWSGFAELEESWTPTQQNDRDWKRHRVPAFRAWLSAQPEDRICAVGHGAFFQELCGKHLRNCEIAEMAL